MSLDQQFGDLEQEASPEELMLSSCQPGEKQGRIP